MGGMPQFTYHIDNMRALSGALLTKLSQLVFLSLRGNCISLSYLYVHLTLALGLRTRQDLVRALDKGRQEGLGTLEDIRLPSLHHTGEVGLL